MAKRKPIRYKAKTQVTLGGDHGTGTAAARSGTVVVPITDSEGRNPNNMGQRRETNVLEGMGLSLRQYQAGVEIRNAFCGVEKLSSGGELKEQVDCTPKPDATIAVQMDAQSRLVSVMRAVPASMRDVVEHVCWYNRPLRRLKGEHYYKRQSELQVALDLVANHMKY